MWWVVHNYVSLNNLFLTYMERVSNILICFGLAVRSWFESNPHNL